MPKLPAHREERRQPLTVNNGKSVYYRYEKYCAVHGWIDVVRIGGETAWNKQHNDCPLDSITGKDVWRETQESGEKDFDDLALKTKSIFNLFVKTANEIVEDTRS